MYKSKITHEMIYYNVFFKHPVQNWLGFATFN